MQKLLAILIVIGLLWYAVPKARAGVWIAPSATPPGWWGVALDPSHGAAMASPGTGAAWYSIY